MRTRTLAVVLALTLASPSLGAPPPADPELARGIKLVEQGEYAQAILALDGTARRLDSTPQTRAQAAEAYLHLGIAYVGDGQEPLARGSFRRALERNEKIELTAFDVSPKVRNLFETVRQEFAAERAAAAAGSAKKGGSKTWLVLGGLALAGVGGAVAASGGFSRQGGGDEAPEGNVTISIVVETPAPPRVPMLGEPITFRAVPSQQQGMGSALYSWDFGDGEQQGGGNISTTHRYSREGQFTVRVTASVAGRTFTGDSTVTIRSLSGIWDGQSANGERFVVQLTHTGAGLGGDADGVTLAGGANSRTNITLIPQNCAPAATVGFSGSINDALTVITGTGGLPCRRAGQIQQTLTRR